MGEAAIVALVGRVFDLLLDLREKVIEAAEQGGQFTEEQRAEQRAQLAMQTSRLAEQDARLEALLADGS